MSGRAHVAIAGGGIGGLALAAALKRIDVDSTVFEKEPAIIPQGSALLAVATAVKALHQLGLGDAFAKASFPRTTGELRTPAGKLLVEMPSSVLVKAFGHPNTNVERTKLRALLFDAAGHDRVRFGRRVQSFEEAGDRIRVALSDGSNESFDAVVGADGLGSAVRSQLLGPARAFYVGFTAWQGAADLTIDAPEGVAMEIWGSGARTGYSYLGNGRWGWWASRLAPEGGADPAQGRLEAIASPFDSWWGHSTRLMRATLPEAVVRVDIRARRPTSVWGRGRATLLGDAAHVMTPDLGQGAGQAIIDAHVLARSVADARSGDLVSAFRAYERARIAPTAFVAKRSLRVGRIAHLRGRPAVGFRNAVIRALPRRAVYNATLRVMRGGSR